jgi:hypothetical protein
LLLESYLHPTVERVKGGRKHGQSSKAKPA